MKPHEIRERTDEELDELLGELRDKLIRYNVARATRRAQNTAQLGRLRRNIARVLTVQRERAQGIGEAAGGPTREEEARE